MAEVPQYRLVLPAGWEHLPLDAGADAVIRRITDRAIQRSPPTHAAQLRSVMSSRLSEAVRGARQGSGVALYLPMEPVQGVPVPMSIVVTAPKPPTSATTMTDALLAFAARGQSSATEVGGHLAVRQWSDALAVVDEKGKIRAPATRRVSYLIAPPFGDRLLAITGSMLRPDIPDGEDVVAALELLFDAIAMTLRFHPRETDTA